MKKYLSAIVKPYGYQNVKEFYAEFKASKAEYDAYQKAVSKWASGTTGEQERISITDQLKAYQEQVKQRENNKEYTTVRPKDRCGRLRADYVKQYQHECIWSYYLMEDGMNICMKLRKNATRE